VVVVNHALLMADIVTGSRVIPEYERLIVDEAHHLEAASTTGLSFHAAEPDLQRLLRDLSTSTSGMLGAAVAVARKTMPKEEAAVLRQTVDGIAALSRTSSEKATSLFAALGTFIESQREGHGPPAYAEQVRISPSTRTVPAWSPVEVAYEELRALA